MMNNTTVLSHSFDFCAAFLVQWSLPNPSCRVKSRRFKNARIRGRGAFPEIMYGPWIVPVLIGTTLSSFCPSSVSAFSPTASPRFDAFSERLIGTWFSEEKKSEVQEVMRSCGGAVQGIKEVSVNGLEPKYMNRANDGFIFMDDGSYTEGPTDIGAKETLWTTLVLDKGLRVIVESTLSMLVDSDQYACSHEFFPLSKKSEKLFSIANTFSEKPEIGLFRQTRCRMSSQSQPWMLHRATWEAAKGGDANISISHEVLDDVKLWLSVMNEQSEGSVTVTVGAVCCDSGLLKAFQRQYSSKKLHHVSYLEGRVVDEDLLSP